MSRVADPCLDDPACVGESARHGVFTWDAIEDGCLDRPVDDDEIRADRPRLWRGTRIHRSADAATNGGTE